MTTTFTTAQVAEMLHTSRNKIDDLRHAGILSGVRLGKTWIFSEKEIDQFLLDYRGESIANKKEMEQSRRRVEIK